MKSMLLGWLGSGFAWFAWILGTLVESLFRSFGTISWLAWACMRRSWKHNQIAIFVSYRGNEEAVLQVRYSNLIALTLQPLGTAFDLAVPLLVIELHVCPLTMGMIHSFAEVIKGSVDGGCLSSGVGQCILI